MPPPPGQAAVAASHQSRLAFQIEAGASIPLDSTSLLDWSGLTPSLTATAAVVEGEEGGATPPIEAPDDAETAIELPYRLLISPDPRARWRNRTQPFSSQGQTELWHSRLVLPGEPDGGELSQTQQAALRAVWSPDYEPSGAGGIPDLGLVAMSAEERRQIVILTSAFTGWENVGSSSLAFAFATVQLGGVFSRAYVPTPFHAELLMLSALGGWLHSRGNWTPPRALPDSLQDDTVKLVDALAALQAKKKPRPQADQIAVRELARPAPAPATEQLDLSEWVHQAAQGRDHYVRIVHEGRLLPFGHRASLIRITERKFKDVGGDVGAYLMQRKYIVVRQPVVEFAADDRGNPLKQVRLTTLVTPDLAGYSQDESATASDPEMLWAEVPAPDGGSAPFPFQCVATDVAGVSVDFSMAMLFVSDRVTDQSTVAQEYNQPTTLSDTTARDATVPGQPVAYTEDAGNAENARLVTELMSFAVGADARLPFLDVAHVRIPQVETLLASDASTRISLFDGYVKNGIDAAGGVFAALPDSLDVQFQAQRAGGFATPNMSVATISRDLGPLAGTINEAVQGVFNPASFFGSLDPQLLGSFKLSDILPTSTLGQNAPRLSTTSSVSPSGGRLVEARLDWHPAVAEPAGQSGFIRFHTAPGAALDVSGVARRLVGGGAGDATSSFSGTLGNVSVEILDAVTVNFRSFTFSSANGAKPVVDVHLAEIPMQFTGDLAFVDELRQQIPPGLFGDGPSIDLVDDPLLGPGVRAWFALGLPPIAVGVFALKDVTLGASAMLPFLAGNPIFDFNVSRRDNPFLVAVAIFGGGGFFHLQCDASGMRELEVSIEFGAAAAIDIGVASGSVHMMAGIYFSLQRTGTAPNTHMAATLSGYLRMGGSLSVLCLITVSVEFNLSFTYDSARDKAYGRATLTVQVEVAFFSKSVDLTVERGFGGNGDPKFQDLMTTPDTWNEYALAFAA